MCAEYVLMCTISAPQVRITMPGSHLVAGCRRFLRWLLILYFFIYITVLTCDILRHKEIKEIKGDKRDKRDMRFSGLFWNAAGVSIDEALPRIVLAVYVRNDKGGKGKAWSGAK